MIKKVLQEHLPILYDSLNWVRKLPLGFAVRRNLSRLQKAPRMDLSVLYLTEKFPASPPTRSEYAHGGTVKMTFLSEFFPHSNPEANLLYTVSSVGHYFSSHIVKEAKSRGLKIVVNQNGVAYPAWHGKGWEKTNRPMKQALEYADYVIYQSDFCRRSADLFLLTPKVNWEILFNPVDTNLFRPMSSFRDDSALTLVLGGNQYERYRFELAVAALAEVARIHPAARLVVTGKLWDTNPNTLQTVRSELDRRGLLGMVEFVGQYTQQQAPAILNRGHILLHTQFNDSCPGIVIEAMSCGLPVVYLESGGTPEVVADAGIGIPVLTSWENNELPDPKLLCEAVNTVIERHGEFSRAARQRAEDVFALEKFVQAHRRIFESLLDSK